jgi:hypothetical protein
MPPTTPQRKYINDLLGEKVVPSDVFEKYGLDDLLPDFGVTLLSVSRATELIEELCKCDTKADDTV